MNLFLQLLFLLDSYEIIYKHPESYDSLRFPILIQITTHLNCLLHPHLHHHRHHYCPHYCFHFRHHHRYRRLLEYLMMKMINSFLQLLSFVN